LEDDYTPEQRDKYIFNREKCIGDEDCTAIFGLANLKNLVTLTNGESVSVRTLLKSIPSTPGMSQNRMFQVIDLIPSHMCTIVTFQQSVRQHIEAFKPRLEQLLRNAILVDQFHLLFVVPEDGNCFVGTMHKKNAKVI
jgi:hypothetical protein